MNDSGARSLLDELGSRLGDRLLLWRGLGGSDVDLVVMDGAEQELAEALSGAGLSPAPGDPGHVVWTSARGGPPLDVLPARLWPRYYPPLAGIRERAAREGPIPVAAPEDRLLMLAAEAVAGRPLAKTTAKMRAILSEDEAAAREAGGDAVAMRVPGTGPEGVAERARRIAVAEGLDEMAELASDPDRLEALARRGRLPYPRALVLAARSRPAREALGARAGGRLRAFLGRPPGLASPLGARHRGLVIALSGMDGAGKSTAAEHIRARLEQHGLPAEIAWARIGGESELLDTLAHPVKRLLRREGTTADPIAAGGPDIAKRQEEAEASGRRRLVSWVWIVIVAAANASSYRRAAARRRTGVSVVCDRWVTDALVDLSLRYGRHPLAEAVLRRTAPRADLALLLEIDARTAARRKPGDQAEHVLGQMQEAYAARAAEDGVTRIDARRTPRDVLDRIDRLLDELLPR